MKPTLKRTIVMAIAAGTTILASDWPQWRGPLESDISDEKNLPPGTSACPIGR